MTFGLFGKENRLLQASSVSTLCVSTGSFFEEAPMHDIKASVMPNKRLSDMCFITTMRLK